MPSGSSNWESTVMVRWPLDKKASSPVCIWDGIVTWQGFIPFHSSPTKCFLSWTWVLWDSSPHSHTSEAQQDWNRGCCMCNLVGIHPLLFVQNSGRFVVSFLSVLQEKFSYGHFSSLWDKLNEITLEKIQNSTLPKALNVLPGIDSMIKDTQHKKKCFGSDIKVFFLLF